MTVDQLIAALQALGPDHAGDSVWIDIGYEYSNELSVEAIETPGPFGSAVFIHGGD